MAIKRDLFKNCVHCLCPWGVVKNKQVFFLGYIPSFPIQYILGNVCYCTKLYTFSLASGTHSYYLLLHIFFFYFFAFKIYDQVYLSRKRMNYNTSIVLGNFMYV